LFTRRPAEKPCASGLGQLQDCLWVSAADIIPLRDLFGLLFFASVGMLLEPRFLLNNLGQVLLLVLLVSVGKWGIFAGLAKIFGYGNVVPLAVGLGLFQIGEFSFVLARVGVTTESIDKDFYNLVLTAAVLTMVLTPIVSAQTGRLYALKKRWFRNDPLESINFPEEALHDHVVIAGGGRVGFQVAAVLDRLGISFVLVKIISPSDRCGWLSTLSTCSGSG